MSNEKKDLATGGGAKKSLFWARRLAATAVLIAFVALFAGLGGKYLAGIAKTQFWPSLLSGAAIGAGAVLAVTLLAGRWYCSVMCPLGILQDAAFALRRKKAQKASGKAQTIVRFSALALFLALGLAGLGWSWLEPYGIFGRAFTMAAGAALAAAICALAAWRGRVWCNWICPVGTCLGLISKIAPLRLGIDGGKCVGCRKCERNCRAAAISIKGKGQGGTIDASKCVECRDCTVICPVGAIGVALPKGPAAPAAAGSGEGLTRRAFIAGAGATAAVIAAHAADDKVFDGGFADVSDPGIDKRNASLKPAGSHSIQNFRTKCVGCGLCVKECPNKVLRPSKRLNDFGQPEMAFDKGFCTVDCTRCSEVCPAGAIEPLRAEEKLHTHIGEARWHAERCLAQTEGVNCTACMRHCPTGAITRVMGDAGALIPVVDAAKCIGCGACEHVCPARPLPGMTVHALEVHREYRKTPASEALAEAVRLLEKDGKSCVLVKAGAIVAVEEGRGVSPLLKLLDAGALAGAVVVDRIIGRAAAAICVSGGAKAVYGLVVSDGAMEFLAAHSIPCRARERTPRIRNRDNTGTCPMEAACEGLGEPGAMVAAVREKLSALRSAPK